MQYVKCSIFLPGISNLNKVAVLRRDLLIAVVEFLQINVKLIGTLKFAVMIQSLKPNIIYKNLSKLFRVILNFKKLSHTICIGFFQL